MHGRAITWWVRQALMVWGHQGECLGKVCLGWVFHIEQPLPCMFLESSEPVHDACQMPPYPGASIYTCVTSTSYLLTGPFSLPSEHLPQRSILWQAWSQYVSCIMTQNGWTHAAFTRQLGQGFWYMVLEPLLSTSGSINPVSG